MAMTVAELMEALQKMPPDAEVIMQKDSEGNGYSPLSSMYQDAIYSPNSTWSGNIYDANWSYEDADFDSLDSWEEYKRSHPRCCLLIPVN